MICTLREWQQRHKNLETLIIQASSKDRRDSWQPFPIGMGFNFSRQSNKGLDLQIGPHEKTMLVSLSLVTDKTRRPTGINRKSIAETLRTNGFPNRFLRDQYFSELPHYKFVASPEGNGIDSHRHYEALLAGCIPIVEHNPLIEDKYKGCPILYTTDFSEITEDYLVTTYERMLDESYDFSRLFLSFYTEEQVHDIKDCGNFWMLKQTKKAWYLDHPTATSNTDTTLIPSKDPAVSIKSYLATMASRSLKR